jgi:hypothetical protein
MPSYTSCDFLPHSYMSDEPKFRNGMNAIGFEPPAPAFLKNTFDFTGYCPPWSATDENTTAIDDSSWCDYDTTPPHDAEQQFMPLSVFAPPPPTPKNDDPGYPFLAGRLDDPFPVVPPPVEEPFEEPFEVKNFPKFQIFIEGPSTQATPSTVVQEPDQRSEPEVGHDEEPLQTRPSRKNSKTDSTLIGQPGRGNNPFGSKGTRTCGSCRKRKGKVFHLN